jgi:hypothetical protein
MFADPTPSAEDITLFLSTSTNLHVVVRRVGERKMVRLCMHMDKFIGCVISWGLGDAFAAGMGTSIKIGGDVSMSDFSNHCTLCLICTLFPCSKHMLHLAHAAQFPCAYIPYALPGQLSKRMNAAVL